MTIKAEKEETKLHAAVRSNDPRLVRKALRAGSDVNSSGMYGWTPLHEASSCGYFEITSILLENGANPNTQDTVQKNTPVHLAAMNGHLEVVKSLVRSGARLDLRNAEGKTPHDSAEEHCKEFLQRQRAEEVIRLTPSAVEGDQSHQKLSERKSTGSPVHKKVRQSSPMWTETLQGSFESMSSGGSDSGESVNGLITAAHQPGPGEINVSFEFNRRYPALKILVWELRDLRLPTDHNITHIYVKSYLSPDKHKATKRKTRLLNIESLRAEGRKSRDSIRSIDSEESNCPERSEKRMSQKVASALKKRPRLSSKKRGCDQVKSVIQLSATDLFCRVSAFFEEILSYDTLTLSKVNLDACTVVLTLCGRNRLTPGSQPLATVSLPLASVIKTVTPQWYPLLYKIEGPSRAFGTGERPALRPSRSWELTDGGEFTGRSLAWVEPTVSLSMPNMDHGTSSVTSQVTQSSKNGGESAPSFAEGQKKYRKHRGAVELLRKEFKVLRGKTNKRYDESATKKEQEEAARFEGTTVETLCGPSFRQCAESDFSEANGAHDALSQTLREQNRDLNLQGLSHRRFNSSRSIANQTQPRLHECSLPLERQSTSEEEEGFSYERESPRPSFCRSLKYSRAFQHNLNPGQRKEAVLSDFDDGHVEEIPEIPFGVNYIYARGRSGIACQ